jgi:mono/diheme cytochrome c family protein
MAIWVLALSTGSQTQGTATPARPPVVAAQAGDSAAQTAVVAKYCVSCHSERAKSGGLSLEGLDLSKPAAHADTWEKVILKLRGGLMPPAGMPRPPEPARVALVSYLESSLDAAAVAAPNAGRPALHRLNRAEYANAIRDLLALEVDAAVLLPPDDSSDGFDNNADVLGVSPALLERYLSAARVVASLALGDPTADPTTRVFRAPPDMSQRQHRDGLPLGTIGGLAATHTFPSDGEYVIKVKLMETTLGQIRGLEHVNRVEVLLDGQRIHLAEVGGAEDYVGSADNATDVLNNINTRLTVRVPVTAGPHALAASFLGRSATQGGNRLQFFQRTNVDTTDHTGVPHIESLTLTGPFNASGAGRTPSRDRVLTCRPPSPAQEGGPASAEATARSRRSSPASLKASEDGCAKQIVETLARRAYRRPVTAQEVARLLTFYNDGRKDGSFDRGIERALRAILTSPKFVFRAEQDAPAPAPARVNDLELASRLSFFLWSSIPDDELVDVAAKGQLRQPAVLERQVRRMLADRRAEALVGNFAGQWLQLRNLRASIPDQNDFPDFDDNLRQAFRRETELLFQSVMREDRSVLDLLTADYTFVNERLARHYKIPSVYGSHFRRVPVTNEARRGLLGHGSILLLTSHPDRTSPVLRGKWILDNLLGTPPPPAPANVPALEESAGQAPRTVREQMEIHRKSASCASCHRMMDPLGLALENFDAVGAWRTRDAGLPLDTAVELVDGTRVTGVAGLRQALLDRRELFVHRLTEKMLTYATGRGLAYYDRPVVRAIARDAARKEFRFSAVVLGVVNSTPFRMRTGGTTGQLARASSEEQR